MSRFDAVVLGAGNAGLAAAQVLREAGRSVAVVERRDVGGTCPLRGCVPKKVLVAAAEALDVMRRAPAMGLEVGSVTPQWWAVIDRQRAILAGTSEALEADLARRGIELVRGDGRFVAPDAIAVGERRLDADAFVVATGSTPRPLTMPGAEHVTLSDELLELREPPRSLAFVGAGVIAFELGHVFARLGTRVTLLEVAQRPLGPFDKDAVERLVAATRALGIEVQLGVELSAVEPSAGGLTVRYRVGGEDRALEVERVGHGAGRIADLARLDLAAADVRVERGGIALGAPYRSASNARVFVAGDALVTTPQLSPLATHEGRVVGRAVLGEDVTIDYASVPSAVFSVPTLATVGLTEERARAAHGEVVVKTNDMRGWRSGRSNGEEHAWAKVILVGDRLVGAHLLGHGAGETIHLFALAMRHGLPAAALRDLVYAYPTFSSDVRYLV
ncbi:MAG: NAD(P)/FAD-dependent oxidoreductase [Myxococcota bacterium]